MESDLLKKEEAFHKLNAELELKTNALMKEMNNVMKYQERIALQCSSESGLRTVPKARGRRRTPASRERKPPSVSSEGRSDVPKKGLGVTRKATGNRGAGENVPVHLLQDSSGSEDGDDELSGLKNIGVASTISFLKAKAKVLQEDHDALEVDYRKAIEDLEKCQAELRCAEEEKRKHASTVTKLQEQLRKLELNFESAQNKLLKTETENASLKKEVESLKKALKQSTQSGNTNELKLNRVLEETEKLRGALKDAHQDEKESRECDRQNIEQLKTANKKLQKQKSEILNAFKKQLELIDNLQRQKAHLESAHLLDLTEEQFVKLLDLKQFENMRSVSE